MLGIRFEHETTLSMGGTFDASGQACATVSGETCARIEQDLPYAAVGRWVAADGLSVEIRRDGYVRVLRGGRPLQEGQLVVAGAAGTIQLCGPVLSSALAFAPDGAPTWDGAPLKLLEQDWDRRP